VNNLRMLDEILALMIKLSFSINFYCELSQSFLIFFLFFYGSVTEFQYWIIAQLTSRFTYL